MNRRVYLIRHGKIDYGKEKCYIGTTDLPLSMEGVVQARKLKEFFENVDIEKVYTSPLIRCVQTANIILEGRNVEKVIVNELKEINMGQWEGKTFKYIKSYFPEQFKERGKNIGNFIPPDGESFNQLKKRAVSAYEAIIENSLGTILIVCHAGVNRVILSDLLSISLNNIFKIEQPYGCINEIYYDAKNKKIQWKTLA